MSKPSGFLYEFDHFRVDTINRLLLRDGIEVSLPLKTYEVLQALVENAGDIVSIEQLLHTVWSDIPVEEANVHQHVHKLNNALGKKLNGEGYIKNFKKRGYRFEERVKKLPYTRPSNFEEGMKAQDMYLSSAEQGERRFFQTTKAHRSFMVWLVEKSKAGQIPAPLLSTKGMREGDVAIRNTVIADTAPNLAGYIVDLDRNQSDFPWSEFNELIRPFSDLWEKYKIENDRFAGVKTAPIEVTFPVSDDANLRIGTADVRFSFTRSFNMLVEENTDIRDELVNRAFQYGERKILGALGIDGVVIMSSEPGGQGYASDRYLLLSHRVKRKGGYNANRWSASFEEQFNPIEFEAEGKVFHADRNLEGTAIRGAKEEFLSDEFSKEVPVSLQAVSIDLVNLNLQLMAVVNLFDTPFSEVKALWSSRKPIDYKEHDVLAAMKIERSILEKAIAAECPDGLVEEISNPDLEDYLKHPWHPRSQARIACCLWMLEEGLLNFSVANR